MLTLFNRVWFWRKRGYSVRRIESSFGVYWQAKIFDNWVLLGFESEAL